MDRIDDASLRTKNITARFAELKKRFPENKWNEFK